MDFYVLHMARVRFKAFSVNSIKSLISKINSIGLSIKLIIDRCLKPAYTTQNRRLLTICATNCSFDH